MEKIYFTNIDSMIKSIKEYTKKNCSYVEAFDEPIKENGSGSGYYGWICRKTNVYFCIFPGNCRFSFNININRYLDSFLKRKIASIYLSNCSNDKEYNFFKKKVNKLKAFW